MMRTTSLIWKEWHEARTYLWIAIGVFIGLPLIGGLESLFQYARHFEIQSSQWVITFGGVLAVFVAVGATCRDFSGHLEDFWRSRPISAAGWMLMKYAVGLAIVLTACVLPLLLESAINRTAQTLLQYAVMPFAWAALYSIAFLAGCLVRRTAHAAMLGLAGMLLIGLLPMVLPFLSWLDASEITGISVYTFSDLVPRGLIFSAGMLGISVVALVIALLAVKCDWRIDSGRKMMYGSISAAILILVSSAAFQLGTNLPILQESEAPTRELIAGFVVNDGLHYAITAHPKDIYTQFVNSPIYRDLEITPGSVRIGNTIGEPRQRYYNAAGFDDAYPPQFPGIGYLVDGRLDSEGKKKQVRLLITDRNGGLSEIPLWTGENGLIRSSLYVWKDRLYVIGDHLMALDISKPLKPRIIFDQPDQDRFDNYQDFRFGHPELASGNPDIGDERMLILPALPDLPAAQRFDVLLTRAWYPPCREGDTFFMTWSGELYAYRLVKLTDRTAKFRVIAKYEPTILEKVFGTSYVSGNDGNMQWMNGFLYVIYGGGGTDPTKPTTLFNPHVLVFDLRGSNPLRPIAHFAAPGFRTIRPLADGRLMIGGSKLWVVGGPKRGTER